MSMSDMVGFAGNGEVPGPGTAGEGSSAGTGTDPVCGMTVTLDADAIFCIVPAPKQVPGAGVRTLADARSDGASHETED